MNAKTPNLTGADSAHEHPPKIRLSSAVVRAHHSALDTAAQRPTTPFLSPKSWSAIQVFMKGRGYYGGSLGEVDKFLAFFPLPLWERVDTSGNE